MGVFFGTAGLILVCTSIPLMAMYACGDFVGQKSPSAFLKNTVMIGVGGGLLIGVVASGLYLRAEGMTYIEWLELAWIAGASIAAQIALLERLGTSGREKDLERSRDRES